MEQFLPFSCNLALVRPEANNTLENQGSGALGAYQPGSAFRGPEENSWFAADKPGDPMSWFNSLKLSVVI